MFLLFVEGQSPAEMSCQQSQQQCQPPPKCPSSPKCPPKSPAQCSPPAPAGCAPGSGGGCSPSSGGGCFLSHHRHHGSHRCRLRSSDTCDSGSGQQSGGSGCGHGSRGCC
ncbi:late cornified envelope protein 3D-like [Ursus maritimus]|uniref:Late cornified envelope protein 3D-like n=2 Tax=Ursus TaxID=9639 RepID=A0A384CG78_URSMA|nr:late cornified envelope protein 3D-like [Ursus maritimus]